MLECPACGLPSSGGAERSIAFCDKCRHRWLRRTAAAHAAVEVATFDEQYSGYRSDPVYLQAATRFVRDELMPRLPPAARILDVGCGAGDFMAVASGQNFQVVGIDISEASAAICRSRGLTAVAGDLLVYEFEGKFDAIVLWDVLAHLRNPGSILARARTLLNERGILFVKTPVFGDLSVNIADHWPRAAGTLLGTPSHSQFFSKQSLTTLLLKSGFEAEWLKGGNARSAGGGGSFKRRFARRLARTIKHLSGDQSVLLAGHAPRSPS